MRSPLLAAVASLVVLAVLAFTLWPTRESALIVYCAASTRPPMEAIAKDYEHATGTKIELRVGGSADLLAKIRLAGSYPGDLFLPADESYLRVAQDAGLVGDVFSLATQTAVVLTAKNIPKRIETWADLTRDDVRIALANPAAAAIGKLTQTHLTITGRWEELNRRVVVSTGTVTEAANAVKLGSVDAAIVWDAVAVHYPEQSAIRLSELNGIVAQVQVAVLKGSTDTPTALRFARYIAGSGLPHFEKAGFRVNSVAGANP